MARRVGIYARVSKAEREDPTSIPVQLADCRRRAEQEGWEVVDEYADTGISAWNPRRKRPEFERLLSDLAQGRIDAVLVREQERLIRQMRDTLRVQDLAVEGRLKLVAATMESDIDFSRARDRDDFRKRASQAEFYSDFLGEKVRATKASQRASGVYLGGGPAFGYRIERGAPTVDPEQAAVIHGLVKLLAEGTSLYRLSLDLNAAGQTTASGGRWFPSTVRRLLQGEHLTGANGYPAILSEVEAAVVRSSIGEQSKLPRGRPKGRRYPLVGYLYCSQCGVKLDTGQRRYRCSVSHGGCGTISILAYPLERHLALETFRHHVSRPKRNKKSAAVPVADTAPLLAELHETEDRAAEVAAGIADGTLSVSVGGEAARKIDERRRELTEALALAVAPVETGPKLNLSGLFTAEEIHSVDPSYPVSEEADLRGDEFRERWAERTLTEAEIARLRDLYVEYLDRATISPRATRGRSFAPERVSISWKS